MKVCNVHDRTIRVCGFRLKPGRSVYIPDRAWEAWLAEPGHASLADAHLLYHKNDEPPPSETPAPKYNGPKSQAEREAEAALIEDERAETNRQESTPARRSKEGPRPSGARGQKIEQRRKK